MIKLSTIISQARSGELKSLSTKDKTDDVIVNYVNMALIALYSRFQLATQEAIVTLRPDIPKTIYTLASTDSDVEVAGQPMDDTEFMCITSVWNEDGSRAGINDNKDASSVFTLNYNQIQVPLLAENGYLSVIYRKNPTLITFVDDGNGNAVDTVVGIPVQLLEAMLHYIGYRAHGSLNGNINTENNTHYMRFDAACNMAAMLGVLTADDVSSLSTEEKGFA